MFVTFFLFSCFAGLAYVDVANLTPNNIITMDGKQWIVTALFEQGSQQLDVVLNSIIMSQDVHTPAFVKADASNKTDKNKVNSR